MRSCHWVQDRLLLYFGGELEPRHADKVVRHLERCERCAELAEQLAETQQIMETRIRAVPVPPTPLSLDERVMAAVHQAPPPRRPWTALVPIQPLWLRPALAMTGVMACLAAGFTLGRFYPEPAKPTVPVIDTLPALEMEALASDYEKYRQASYQMEFETADPAALSHAMSRHVPFRVEPVDLRAQGARLVGGQCCYLQQKSTALLMYEWNQEKVSLFQVDARAQRLPPLPNSASGNACFLVGEQGGRSYALWCAGKSHYVLMGRIPAQQLVRLASAAIGCESRSR